MKGSFMEKNRNVVVMTGTSEDANGGITAVMKLMKRMPVWEKYNVYWLATQTNETGKKSKLWMAIKAAVKAPFLIKSCKIVHFHMVPGITLLIQLPELLVAKLFRKKVILEVHVGNQLEHYAKDRFFKWWFKRADLILLLAKRWEELFKTSYSDVNVSTDVLYNACELRPFIPMNTKKKEILFCGTIHDNKAPDLLIKAWAALKDKYPEWTISFLGSGEIDYYMNMAKDLGVDNCISFTGFISGEKKERYFQDASILCLCSYMEGFPMAVLEAWSHSIAVVTTPVGGLPDVVQEGDNCLTFPMGNSSVLARQLEKLITDSELRQRVSKGGYELAEHNFSIATISNKLDEIYSSLLK